MLVLPEFDFSRWPVARGDRLTNGSARMVKSWAHGGRAGGSFIVHPEFNFIDVLWGEGVGVIKKTRRNRYERREEIILFAV